MMSYCFLVAAICCSNPSSSISTTAAVATPFREAIEDCDPEPDSRSSASSSSSWDIAECSEVCEVGLSRFFFGEISLGSLSFLVPRFPLVATGSCISASSKLTPSSASSETS
uniref:(northern house mosquito) hypothetical protein n=1 Tax=Culex pipiens TaxID=7175 RepID=A0A8D8CVZ6_CULPI